MSDRPRNLVADLMDLRSTIVQVDDSDAVQIHSVLRIGKPLIDNPLGKIVAVRAFLQLELDGYDISLANRLGEPVRMPVVEETKKVVENTRQSSMSGGLGGKVSTAGTMGGAATAELAASDSTKAKTTTTAKSKDVKSYVKALGGDRWEITPGDAPHLDGTYITHDDPLCRMERSKGANRASVRVTGYVLRRDLKLIPEARFGLMGHNQAKVLEAFFSKKIGDEAGVTGGKLTVCIQEIDDD